MSRELKKSDTLPVTGSELERAETNSAPLFPAMASATAGPARSRALTPSRRGATMGSIPREQIPRILADARIRLCKKSRVYSDFHFADFNNKFTILFVPFSNLTFKFF